MIKEFTSELIASTELHAGGHLFGLVFYKILSFDDDGTVILQKRVADGFNPLSTNDIEHLNSFRIEGVWKQTNSGEIVCQFETIFLKMKGLDSPNQGSRRIFHCIDSRLSREWGEVYTANA